MLSTQNFQLRIVAFERWCFFCFQKSRFRYLPRKCLNSRPSSANICKKLKDFDTLQREWTFKKECVAIQGGMRISERDFRTKNKVLIFLNREFDAFYSKFLVENSCIRKVVFFCFQKSRFRYLPRKCLNSRPSSANICKKLYENLVF